jgi:hypothetical protein
MFVIPGEGGDPFGRVNMDSRVRGNDERVLKCRVRGNDERGAVEHVPTERSVPLKLRRAERQSDQLGERRYATAGSD